MNRDKNLIQKIFPSAICFVVGKRGAEFSFDSATEIKELKKKNSSTNIENSINTHNEEIEDKDIVHSIVHMASLLILIE